MILNDLPQSWDLVVIGGGITGAGILREATRMGLKVLLVEQNDFAWGTSSRSSKLVHGGLRYLKEGHFLLTKMSVQERERLLKEAPGLVEPLGFYLPVYETQRPGKRTLQVGLSLYDLIARERHHKFYDAPELLRRLPHLKPEGLVGGFYFEDAQVDDSRLVLRLIYESIAAGAQALNYTTAVEIQRDAQGDVAGLTVMDTETRERRTLATPAVINATGCWAEKLHPSPEPHRHLRPLRGSHLVFSSQAIPLQEGLSFLHPLDNRPVFAVPWEGAVLVGTTDLDHRQDLSAEPTITREEITYLLEGLRYILPTLRASLTDCLSVFAGIRPVLSEGKLPASAESREHVVWMEKGLITVTGGKLTTFRRLALDALKAAAAFLPADKAVDDHAAVFEPLAESGKNDFGLDPKQWRRLQGRYGATADEIIRSTRPEDLCVIPGTMTLWAELPIVARHEHVRHLGDLLLRRVRIGLLAPQGGKAYLKRIRKLCQASLPWDRKRWKAEIDRYLTHWNRIHRAPWEPPRKGTGLINWVRRIKHWKDNQ
jgi:glycerol-3-phosphate dehydrogenase